MRGAWIPRRPEFPDRWASLCFGALVIGSFHSSQTSRICSTICLRVLLTWKIKAQACRYRVLCSTKASACSWVTGLTVGFDFSLQLLAQFRAQPSCLFGGRSFCRGDSAVEDSRIEKPKSQFDFHFAIAGLTAVCKLDGGLLRRGRSACGSVSEG
jgi:hypothetical protein